MEKRTRMIVGVALSGLACACGLVAQAPTNPISTKPEGTLPTCSYTGGITDGKPSGSNTCTPAPAPGTDPNLILPKSAAQQFPFPGEMPVAPSTATPQNPAAPVPSAGTPAPGDATQRFPFPGEPANSGTGSPNGNAPSSSARPDSGSSPLQDAGSSGSSSSSSSSGSGQAEPGYSSSGAGGTLPDDDPDAPMPTPHHSANRKKLPAPEKVLTPDEKEAEDLQIAGFYQNDGNFKAAYDRAKEAVGLQNDDPDAHLALAEAARKLGKLDEAESNYKRTLALDPVPKTRKVAEKALKEMSGS